jgi:signal transduction histidine kinase
MKLFWWHVAVVGTVVVLTVLLLIEQAPTARVIGAVCSLVVLAAGWFLFGRYGRENARSSLALTATVVVASGVGVAFYPTVAIVQTIAFPLVWFYCEGVRRAIISNVLLVISISAGFVVFGGVGRANLQQTAITEGISLGLSLALGLWFNRVYDAIDERQALIDRLEAAHEELAALSRDAGAAAERERLARELHDTLAQDLTGLVLTAQRGLRELSAGNTADAQKQLTVLEENARHALTETRTLVASGAAVGVDGGGLAIALRRLAERFERETGIRVTVTAADSASLDRPSEVVLLRCAQEALANVRKHSTAKTAAVALEVVDGGVDLSITDDGAGFDPAASSSGFGLSGLRDRLALVRGTLAVSASPGGGTTLVASLPGSPEAVA